MGLHKILKIVALILGVVGIVFWFLILSKGDDAIEATGEGVDPMLYIAYITLGIVLLFVLIFVVFVFFVVAASIALRFPGRCGVRGGLAFRFLNAHTWHTHDIQPLHELHGTHACIYILHMT